MDQTGRRILREEKENIFDIILWERSQFFFGFHILLSYFFYYNHVHYPSRVYLFFPDDSSFKEEVFFHVFLLGASPLRTLRANPILCERNGRGNNYDEAIQLITPKLFL